jgi:predicted DNA-binding protein
MMLTAPHVNNYLALFLGGDIKVQMTALTLRIEPALYQRLEECASRTRIKKYTLAILAIEAAVEAIEKNDFRLVVPIQFELVRVPAEKTGNKISYRSQAPGLNEVRETPVAAVPPPKRKRAA